MANLYPILSSRLTFIGWIILLAVSINTNKEAERIRQQQMMMQMAGQQGSSDTFNPFQ